MGGVVVAAGLLPAVALAACPPPDALKISEFERSFVQEKHVSGLDKPLRSQGEMSVNENEIIWHMKKPFDVRTVMNATGITQSVDGAAPVPVGPESLNIAGGIAKSMASIMRGEWSALAQIFAIDKNAEQGDGDWAVSLVPHDDRLGALIGRIVVHGCTDVSHVDIVRPDGDSESISFGPVKP
ncbi:MAG: outer membrane lipoprotein carrier protein LolA [Pseudomonadota bacterium]